MLIESGSLPLTGFRVLDLCGGPGELASRFLGDLGADVIRVEKPGASVPDPVSRVVNAANKRSVALDLEKSLDNFWALAESCDLVFEDSPPQHHGHNPISPARLRQRFPSLVVVSVTPFGQDGPYRDWQASDGVHLALCGLLSRSGLPGLPPLLSPGRLPTQSAALQAAWGGLLALVNRLDTGEGDHVDCSVMESTMQTLDPAFGIGGSAKGGVSASEGPRGRPDARHFYPIFRCADGWVRLCILAPRQWQGMFRWLGEPEDLADPSLASLVHRFAAVDRIHRAIQQLFADRSRESIVAEGAQYGVPTAALLTPHEVLSADHFAARQAFLVTTADGERASLVNGALEIDGRRAGIRTPAPAVGAHTAEVLQHLGSLDAASSGHPALTQSHEWPRLPLTGLRVLDLGVIVVGAELGRLMADMGAEVIKVENGAFPDGSRQSLAGERMTESFAWGHRNKAGLGLNLRHPEGIALFKQLAAASDVVLSNFKPGTMESLGLGYDVLSEINPSLVMADSSAFGPTGPWSRRMGYGPLVRAETGLSGLWSYPELEDSFSDASTIYPDHVAARVGAVGVLALLLRRRRTGRGGTASVAQAEVILSQMAVDFARESIAPGSLVAVGNSVPGDAPNGVFPCMGDDEWAVVAVSHDDHFAGLAKAIDQPHLADDPRFADAHARERHRAELEALLTAWTVERPPREVAEVLQGVGVPAAPMNRVEDLHMDPHLAHRGFFRTMTHPLLPGAFPGEGGPASFERIAEPPLRPAPLPGEHSREVLARVLSLDEPTIDQLIDDGVVEALIPALGQPG